MKKKLLIKVFISFFTVILIFQTGFLTVFADYYNAENGYGKQTTPQSYQVTDVIADFGEYGSLLKPSDIFIDSKDNIYILDSGNKRIVKLNSEGELTAVYEGKYGKEKLELNNPGGIYVDEDEDIYVADTDNGRILHLDKEGDFTEAFYQPDESTYDNSLEFKPSKLYIDSLGRIYIVNSHDYHGLITIDGENKFIGYIGATKIGFNLLNAIIRKVATKEQQEQLAKEVPAYFSNFVISDDGFIYAVSYWEKTNQLKKLTVSGDNVFPEKVYGEFNDNEDFGGRPAFVDIAVGRNGMIYAADQVLNQINVYDRDGNNLVSFGQSGVEKGEYNSISALSIDSKDNLYIVDNVLNIVQVLTPTEIMSNVIKAAEYYNDGKYEEAVEPWKSVLESDNTHTMAMNGIAKAYYRSGNLENAMELYESSNNKEGYSDVFYDYRLQIIREHFALILFGIIAVSVVVYMSITKLSKKTALYGSITFEFGGGHSVKTYARLFLMSVFHPLDAFEKVKQHRKDIKVSFAAVLLIILVAVRICSSYLTGFPFLKTNTSGIDFVQELAVFFIPFIAWVAVFYAVSMINDGKQTAKETLTSALLSFVPYMVLSIPAALISRILCLEESFLYFLITYGLLLWCIILLLVCEKIMNEYSLKKFIGIIFISLFGVLCLFMIVFLFYIVIFHCLSLVKELWFEITMLGLRD